MKNKNGHYSAISILMRNKLTVVGLVILILLAVTGILAGVLSPYDPNEVDMGSKLLTPCLQHPFGTDNFGRDILTRVLYGARISLWLGLVSAGISFFAGTILGAVAGYYQGTPGIIIMRLMDAVSSFPALILAITIATLIGRGITSAVIAVGIVGIPDFARLTYSQTMSVKKKGFVEAERAIGLTDGEILRKHIFPNCISTLIVRLTVNMGSAILIISALSFIGLGVQPPTAEWGNMISDGRNYIISGEWWLVTFPGAAIALSVLSFNLIGDGIRDVLDPRCKTGA